MADTNRARKGLQTLCRYGCFTGLLPYSWDHSKGQLSPGSRSSLMLFNVHKSATIAYLAHGWFRILEDHFQGEFSLLSGLWGISSCTTTAGLVTIACYKDEIMHFGNRLLKGSFLHPQQDQKDKPKRLADPEVHRIQREYQKMMNRHMLFNMILLYTNPEVHSLIVYQNPCATNFVSSLFFNCKSTLDRPGALLQQLPFLALEAYATCRWQYVCSFMWSLIFLGLASIGMEVKQLESVTMKRYTWNGQWEEMLVQFRKRELGVTLLNSTFQYYLIAFPPVGVAMVAMLLFGTIRMWRVDPQSNIMFPLCAIRCGFEVLTPIAMAGTLNGLSAKSLHKWKKLFSNSRFWASRNLKKKSNADRETLEIKVRSGMGKAGGKSHQKLVLAMQKSCRKLQCMAGSLYSLEHSIVLVTVDNCIQIAVNFLVSFPAST